MATISSPVLRHVHITVEDPRGLAQWYVRVLGLHVVHEFRDKLVIVGGVDGCQLGFEQGQPIGRPENLHLILRVADIDAVSPAAEPKR